MLTDQFSSLEIRNPGFSLKSPEHLGAQPRSPKAAAVLHATRFAETKGSGNRVMRDTMAGAGLTPPLFESDRGRDEFVARYFFHHLLGADDVAWLGRFRDLHLTDDEARALIVAREAGAIDNATYRELTRVDANAASAALRRLRDADVLVQQGRGSATYYVPGPRMLAASSAVGLGMSLSGESRSLCRESHALSGESQRVSGKLDGLSRELPQQPRPPRRKLAAHCSRRCPATWPPAWAPWYGGAHRTRSGW